MTRREATLFALAALLLAISLLLFLGAMNEASACGSWRWPVKTLSDPDANQVDHEPQGVSIGHLADMLAPPFLGALTGRIVPTETQVYRVTARAVGVRLEEDGDIHLALRARRRQMITEAPSPACTHGASRSDRRAMQIARRWIMRRFHPTRYWKTISAPVVVTGAGFWDELHGVRGAAKNGFELHPLLSARRG